MDGMQVFNGAMSKNLIENAKFLLGRANYLKTHAMIARKLKKQEKIRVKILKNDHITVPPILIISVTNDCNLICKGCYACAQHRVKEDEMTIDDIDRIVKEGIDLGVSIVLIAGGEPLVKENILNIPKKYKDTLFVMFTNGLLIDDHMRNEIKNIKNLIPILSLEGDEKATDERRGDGVYKNVIGVMENLDTDKIIFGTSITLTRENYNLITRPEYLMGLKKIGCRIVFLIEYVPSNGEMDLCLTKKQKKDLIGQIKHIQKEYGIFAIALPGDQAQFGGCLAAARGFVHISSTGNIEACPFTPISDSNLKEKSLKDALQSKLLKAIRENKHLLEEAQGGCVLYENQQWVEGLISS